MARRLVKGGKRREQKRQDALMQVIEREFQPRIAAELSRAMNDAITSYEEGRGVPLMADHRQAMTRILEDMAAMTVRVFAGRILVQGEEKGVLNLELKDFADTVRKLAQRYIIMEAFRRHITNITETTRGNIITAIARGESEGLGIVAIARFVRDLVPALSVARSSLIARTETHGAANYGADAAAKETGLTLRKEWVSAADERTRKSHAEADGQVVGMDEYFQVGGDSLMYPGDPSADVSQIANCRCSVSHIVVD
jgi:uncharacterized protein with gpF-like domain